VGGGSCVTTIIAGWSRNLLTSSVKLVGHVLHVAMLMHGLAVFVGNQISIQIDWLVANFARYFWDRVTTHKNPLRTVTGSVG
jgi:hypothetical protein